MNDITLDERVWTVAERVTRVETLLEGHAKESQDFRVSSNTRMDRLETKMTGMDGKLDTVLSEIKTAKTVVGGGIGLFRWIGQQAPAAGIGGVASWIASHFLK